MSDENISKIKKGNVKNSIPLEGNYASMTPTAFEAYVRSLFRGKRKQKNSIIQDYFVRCNKVKTTPDGLLQISGKIKYSYLFRDCLALIECKCYDGPVKRKQICELKQKMKIAGAQKGIFVTTSYYQFGAIKYAKENGIFLISILNWDTQYTIRNEEIKKGYYSGRPEIRIQSYRAARIKLENDMEASFKFFDNPRDLLFFLIGNNM